MAFTCGFYNGPNRMYNAEQLSSIFDGIISDGMYSNYRNSMIVIESENDSEVIVQPGRAWLMHTWSLVDANLPVEAPQSEVVLDRIDALVIDVNTNPEVKNNEITWVTGTPSSQDPQRPTLLNEEFHKQYPLCYVYRAAGTEHIAQENITNVVGTSEFPFVTGIIDTINTDQLILQWEAQWETFMETYTSEAETWIDTQEGSFLTWSTAQRTAFETWFESIRGILDQDAAGHIMNIIDARIPAYDSENPAQQITAVRSRKGNYISELRVYANAKPRLFQSVDGGQTWEDSSVGGFEPVEISYEDYLELTDEEKDAGDWYVVGMPPMGLNAKTIPYHGDISDTENVEDAIDEVHLNSTKINTTTKTLWGYINGEWVDLHIRAYYDAIVIWKNGNFGIAVENGVYNTVSANPAYGGFVISDESLYWNLPLSQSLSAATLVVTDKIDFSAYTSVKVKYSQGSRTLEATLNVSGYDGENYLCVDIERNSSNAVLKILVSSQKTLFADHVVDNLVSYGALNVGHDVSIYEIILE